MQDCHDTHSLGGKFSLWEGGVRGLGIFWAPWMVKPSKYKGLVHISDILPTLLSATKQKIPKGLDGIPLWDKITTGKGRERTE